MLSLGMVNQGVAPCQIELKTVERDQRETLSAGTAYLEVVSARSNFKHCHGTVHAEKLHRLGLGCRQVAFGNHLRALGRHIHRRSCVDGNCDIQLELAIGDLPLNRSASTGPSSTRPIHLIATSSHPCPTPEPSRSTAFLFAAACLDTRPGSSDHRPPFRCPKGLLSRLPASQHYWPQGPDRPFVFVHAHRTPRPRKAWEQ
jgi:hypothetical protein